MVKNVTGQVVRGQDFFGRADEISKFWNRLDTDNLLLLAPRRVGKSSLMRQMHSEASTHGFTSIFIDVSDCGDELHFVQRLYTAVLNNHGGAERMWQRIKESSIGKTISRVDKIGVPGFAALQLSTTEVEWAQVGEDLAKSLAEGERTLLQIDELPVFLLKLLNRTDQTGEGRVREFLYWMRRLRQTYPDVRWLLAGSIGLDTVASRLNIADAINDLRIVSLGAFDYTTSHSFLEALAQSYDIILEETVRSHLLDRIGWLIPFYQQLIFDGLRHIPKPSPGDVDQAMEELLKPHNKVRFDYWRQRLWDELGQPDGDSAKVLLDAACHTPQGASHAVFLQTLTRHIQDPARRADKLRYLLDVLENDGYLVVEQDRWSFRSPLLREYWYRRVAAPRESNG